MSSTLHITLDEREERRVRRLKEEMDVTWAEFMAIAAENGGEMLQSVQESTDEDDEYGGPFVELAGSLAGETDEEGRTGTEILHAERQKDERKERETLERLGIEESSTDG